MDLISQKTILLKPEDSLLDNFTLHQSLLIHSPDIQVGLSSRTVCWKMLEISWGFCIFDKCVFSFIFWLGKAVKTVSAIGRNGTQSTTEKHKLCSYLKVKGFPQTVPMSDAFRGEITV